jgi:hypothetical protein
MDDFVQGYAEARAIIAAWNPKRSLHALICPRRPIVTRVRKQGHTVYQGATGLFLLDELAHVAADPVSAPEGKSVRAAPAVLEMPRAHSAGDMVAREAPRKVLRPSRFHPGMWSEEIEPPAAPPRPRPDEDTAA